MPALPDTRRFFGNPAPFFSNSAWSVAGNSVYALCQWGMLVVLARAGNPSLVGQFALGLAVAAPVFLFANLQIRAIQSTDVRQEYSFGDYLGLRLLTTAGALIVLAGIIGVAGYSSGTTTRVILAVGLAKAFEAVSDVFHGDLQRRERMRQVAVYLILKGLLSVAAMGVAVWLTGSALAGALAMAAVFASVLVFGELRFAVAVPRVNWNWRAFRRLSVIALPLGFVMMMISVTANMPRYFVESALGAKGLGVFAALTYLGVAATMLVNAIGLAATPRLARLYISDSRGAFPQLLLRGSLLATIPGLAAIGILATFGEPVLRLVYGQAYAAHVDVAIWVMAAAALACAASVLGYGLTAARCFHQQVPLFVVVMGIAALAMYELVPRYGLVGAAAGQIVTAVAQLSGSALILYFAVRRQTALAPLTASEVAA